MAGTRLRPDLLVPIAGGGALGALLRYGVGTVLPGAAATLLVNAVGSLALAVVLYGAIYTGGLGVRARAAATTGLLSSFTTYSTFAVETVTLAPPLAVGNVIAHYALGIAGVLLGRRIAARIAGTRRDPP